MRRLVAVLIGLLAMGSASVSHAQPACSAEQGQAFIDEARYKQAVKEFTCVIDAQPAGIEGYRGRIEAQLLLGLYSDALRDFARVTALVLPVDPDATATLFAHYDAHLARTRTAFRRSPARASRAGGTSSIRRRHTCSIICLRSIRITSTATCFVDRAGCFAAPPTPASPISTPHSGSRRRIRISTSSSPTPTPMA